MKKIFAVYILAVVPFFSYAQTIDITYPSTGVLGNPSQLTLKSGISEIRIFGFTLTVNGSVASNPKLLQFTILLSSNSFSFNNQTKDAFSNFRLFRDNVEISSDVNYTFNDSYPNTFITFSFKKDEPLTNTNGNTTTYYLAADVDPDVGNYNPKVTPSITSSNGDLKSTAGIFNNATISGNTYSFSSTKPPILLGDSSIPYSGQLNVNPNTTEILLKFNTPVISLDNNISMPSVQLVDRVNNTVVADLIAPKGNSFAKNPQYFSTSSNSFVFGTSTILTYTIQFRPRHTSLKPDSIYYVTIAPGQFVPDNRDLSLSVGVGISNDGLNYFGGISSSDVYYFKTSNNSIPNLKSISKEFIGSDLVLFKSMFDQLGTAYYIILENGSDPPSLENITNHLKSPYNGRGIVVTQGNYLITKASQAQQITITAKFKTSTSYDIYIVGASNDVQLDNKTPINPPVFSNIYGGGTKPTYTFRSATEFDESYSPNYKICPNSNQVFSDPIILGEKLKNDFNSSTMGQLNFQISLQSGYQFDINRPPAVQLVGGDFNNKPAKITFKNNSVLNIDIKESKISSNSTNYIVISNLSFSTSITTSVLDYISISSNSNSSPSITSFLIINRPSLGFDNSYNMHGGPFPIHSDQPIKVIPNSYIDIVDLTIPKGRIRFYPNNISPNDYNPSTFSGNGVINNFLNLTAVQQGVPFTITMTHIDPNADGCVIQVPQQYLVYDPTSIISPQLGDGLLSKNIPAGTAQAIVNSNFPKPAAYNPILSKQLNPSLPLQFNSNPGYYLSQLTVDLPKEMRINSDKDVVLSGAAWQNWVHTFLISDFLSHDNVIPSQKYFDYNWDYSFVLNADNYPTVINKPSITTANGYTNVYNGPQGRYAKSTNAGNYYWTGGTLGKVEFTGLYNNASNLASFIPFKQQVELFVPPVPLIEIPTLHRSDFKDITPNNGTTPEDHINRFQFPNVPTNSKIGTYIFCENDGDVDGKITINGYPTPGASTQTGVFDVFVFASYDFSKNPQENVSSINKPSLIKNTDGSSLYTDNKLRFTDNHNGSANIYPKNLQNGYKDILITYTYSESNSPASGVAYAIIRVEPNPVAKFTAASVVNTNQAGVVESGAENSTKFCIGSTVQFNTDQSSLPNADPINNFINDYSWNFGDKTLINGNGNDTIPKKDRQVGTSAPQKYNNPEHIYNTANQYNATLTLTSNWGCASTYSLPTQINVGTIPISDFTFIGNCVKSKISFTDHTLPTDATLPIAPNTINTDTHQWNFDLSGAPTNFSTGDNINIDNSYSQPGTYEVAERVTSKLGCVNTVKKFAGILNTFTSEDSPLNFDGDSKGWIGLDISGKVLNYEGKIVPPNVSDAKVSWNWGQPQAKEQSAFKANNKNWSTTSYKYKNGNVTYYPLENSALFTGCFDLNGVTRPLMTFDAYIDLNDGDGLVLQWSTSEGTNIMDSKKEWNTLGSDAAGKEPGSQWYDKAGIASNPGLPFGINLSSYGWTGTSSSWKAPKHTLDAVSPISSPIIFRFAFANLSTDKSAYTDGVGIDNVSFGSRTRTVLLEEFTTTDGGGVVPNTTLLKEANAIQDFYTTGVKDAQIANINYHLGLVGDDPFYLDNTADASARSLYYNVKQVPWALIDGVHGAPAGQDLFQNWGQGYFDLQTLQVAKANFLDLSATPTTVTTTNIDGTVTADVHITPLVDLPASTVLHMAVLEKEIKTIPSYGKVSTGETSFYYTMAKLVPDATGTKIGALTTKTPFNLPNPLKWIPNRNKIHGDRLAVVLFLQNENTKEVYQAELFDDRLLPTPVTDVTPLSSENVTIYPNPSDNEFTIVLPQAVTQPLSVYLVNQLGQQTEVGLFTEGEQKKTIDTKGFHEGLYILQIGGDNAIVRSKLIVLHR